MSQLRFDGKVVIITGGGGALGRAHALLFASRGASVVVNDLGVSLSGDKDASSLSSAEKVVNEIKSHGFKAIANHDDVYEGQRIVDAAIKAFGRVDIVINNAGILRDKSFSKMTDEMWHSVMKVHLDGAFKLTRAAWPYMVKQNYGRVIFTSSAAGLYGNYGQANYSAAKLALVGFANTLSKEGASHNIIVNTIAPVAGSRMTETMMPKDTVAALKPEYISPLVLLLCHESNTVTGEVFECGAGAYSRVRFQRNQGAHFPIAVPPTPEDLKQKWSSIDSFPQDSSNSTCTYPTSAQDSFMSIVSNLQNNSTSSPSSSHSPSPSPKPQSSTPTVSEKTKEKVKDSSESSEKVVEPTKYNRGKDIPGEFKSATIIDILREFMDKDVVNKTKAIFVFDVTNADKKNRKWTIDLKNGNGSISEGMTENPKPDAILSVSDEDFVKLVYQDSNPQKLFMTGKLKVKGNLALAMKFENVLRSMESKAKGKL